MVYLSDSGLRLVGFRSAPMSWILVPFHFHCLTNTLLKVVFPASPQVPGITDSESDKFSLNSALQLTATKMFNVLCTLNLSFFKHRTEMPLWSDIDKINDTPHHSVGHNCVAHGWEALLFSEAHGRVSGTTGLKNHILHVRQLWYCLTKTDERSWGCKGPKLESIRSLLWVLN